MAVEIERKFLVADGAWRGEAVQRLDICQAYLSSASENTIRVRIVDDREGWITVKSGYRGLARQEFEYAIPYADATQLLSTRRTGLIEKTRHIVHHAGRVWEVDEFSGLNRGLVIAEVELDDEQDDVELPAWVGAEVTGQRQYHNSQLVVQPFSAWRDGVPIGKIIDLQLEREVLDLSVA